MNTVTVRANISLGFRFVYIFGIVLAIVVSFSQKGSSKNLLILSVLHVVFLCLLACFQPNKKAAGNRVQTAGYLHTLVGFTAALLLLKNYQPGNFHQVLFPIGSALFTSIIGWLFGGEISSWDEDNEKFDLVIGKVHDEYINTIKDASSAFSELHKKQEKFLKDNIIIQKQILANLSHSNNNIKQINKSLSASINTTKLFSEHMSEVAKQAKQTSQALEQSREAIKQAREAIKQARSLISELERLLEYIASKRG